MQDLPELYILRHGETEWNRARRMQGGLDSPLTDLGRDQARAMGRVLATSGVSAGTHRWRCSPSGRAQETARLALGAASPADPDLAEIGMGDWAGLSLEEIARRWPGPEDEDLLGFYDRAPRGEGLEALWERAGRVLDAIDGPSVLVTHGMTARVLRTRALGWDRDRLLELPGGQGVVWRLRDGGHETLAAPLDDASGRSLARRGRGG